MKNCPNCGFSRVTSNKFNIPAPLRFGQGAAAARFTGHPLIAMGLLLGGAAAQIVNEIRQDYRCDHCDHRFS